MSNDVPLPRHDCLFVCDCCHRDQRILQSTYKLTRHGVINVQEDRAGMKRISPAAALQSEGHFDFFLPVDAMDEPFEFDQPIQCPSPESSITEVSLKSFACCSHDI